MGRQSAGYNYHKSQKTKDKNYYITNVVILKKKNKETKEYELGVAYQAVLMPRSRLNIAPEKEKAFLDGMKIRQKRYDVKNIMVTVDPSVKDDLLEPMFNNPIYIARGLKASIKTYICVGGSTYKCLDTGELYVNSAAIPCEDNVTLIYNFSDFSPSNRKKNEVMYANMSVKDIISFMDKVSNGAFGMFLDNVCKLKGKAREEYVVLNYVRFGCLRAGSVNYGQVPGYHVYHGKFQVPDNEEKMLSKTALDAIDKFNYGLIDEAEYSNRMNMALAMDFFIQGIDGINPVNGLILSDMTGIPVTQLIGNMAQERTSMHKRGLLICSAFVYGLFLRGVKTLASKTGVQLNEYGDPKKSLFISDMNGLKMDYDYSQSINLEILRFSKQSTIRMSSQMMRVLFFVGEQTGIDMKDILQKMADLEVKELFKEFFAVEEEDQKALVSKVSPEKLQRALQGGYVEDLLVSRDPSLLHCFRGLCNSQLAQKLNRAAELCSKVNFNVCGHTYMMAPDITYFLSNCKVAGLLKYGECFVNRKTPMLIGFKHPLPGNLEYLKLKNISLKEIELRASKLLDGGKITRQEFDGIVEMFKTLDPSVIILAISKAAQLKAAGYDFDTDCIQALEYKLGKCSELQTLTNAIIMACWNCDEEITVIESKDEI